VALLVGGLATIAAATPLAVRYLRRPVRPPAVPASMDLQGQAPAGDAGLGIGRRAALG